MRRAELGNGVFEGVPADEGGEVEVGGVGGLVVDEGLDAAFDVSGPAFVEPEVFPG